METRYRTPDLYFEKQVTAQRYRPLQRVDISTTAFLGFTTRGPVSTPVRVTSWKSFEAIFGGFAQEYCLPQCVYGFFANGGAEAVVLRIARLEGEGATTQAQAVVRDLYGRPTLRVTSKDPGSWGNSIQFRVASGSKPARTQLLAPLETGATEAEVRVTRGLEPGAVLRLSQGSRSEYVTLSEVAHKRLRWEQGLQADYLPERTSVEGVEIQVTVSSPFGFEIHDNLAFVPGHSRNLERVVNERSALVQVERIRNPTPSPYNLPQAEVEVSLSGGVDGLGKVTPAEFMGLDRGLGNRTGLLTLEDMEDVGLICAPDLHTALERGDFQSEDEIEIVQRALVEFCERKKTAFALLDVPKGFDPEQALDWRARFESKYGALYYPWYVVQDQTQPAGAGATRLLPPCGHLAGLTAHTDHAEGVHRVAANLRLKDVLALERSLDKDVLDWMNPEGVNCSRAYRGRGIRPWGARTISSETPWAHINVRRLFIMVERTIAEGTEWAVFESNTHETWKAIERQINSFLYDLWREGALMGEVPEDAFFVRCDEQLNPPETRDAGEIHCEIGLAPVRPAEFIVFRIGQQAQDVITETEGA